MKRLLGLVVFWVIAGVTGVTHPAGTPMVSRVADGIGAIWCYTILREWKDRVK